MNKHIKKNFKFIALGVFAIALLGIIYYATYPNIKMSILNNKAIVATKSYLQENKINLGENETLTAFLPILNTQGYLDIDNECLAYSYVKVEGTNYEPHLICGEPSEEEKNTFQTYLSEISSYSTASLYDTEEDEDNPFVMKDWKYLTIHTVNNVKSKSPSPTNAAFVDVLVVLLDYKVTDSIDWETDSQNWHETGYIPSELEELLKDNEWTAIKVGNNFALTKSFTQNSNDSIYLWNNQVYNETNYQACFDLETGSWGTYCTTVIIDVNYIDRTNPMINLEIKDSENENLILANQNNWYNEPATINVLCEDESNLPDIKSGIASCEYKLISEPNNITWEPLINSETHVIESKDYIPYITGTIPVPSSGTYLIKTEDIAGNIRYKTIEIKIDEDEPNVTINDLPTPNGENNWYLSSLLVSGNITDEDSGLASAKVCVTTSSTKPNSADSCWTDLIMTENGDFTFEISEHSNSNYYYIDVKDNADNTDSKTNAVPIKINHRDPEFISGITSPVTLNYEDSFNINDYITNNLSVQTSFTELDSSVKITYTGEVKTNASGFLIPGSYPITFTATDDSGRSVTKLVIFVVESDVLAPIIKYGDATSTNQLPQGETTYKSKEDIVVQIESQGKEFNLEEIKKLDNAWECISTDNCQIITKTYTTSDKLAVNDLLLVTDIDNLSFYVTISVDIDKTAPKLISSTTYSPSKPLTNYAPGEWSVNTTIYVDKKLDDTVMNALGWYYKEEQSNSTTWAYTKVIKINEQSITLTDTYGNVSSDATIDVDWIPTEELRIDIESLPSNYKVYGNTITISGTNSSATPLKVSIPFNREITLTADEVSAGWTVEADGKTISKIIKEDNTYNITPHANSGELFGALTDNINGTPISIIITDYFDNGITETDITSIKYEDGENGQNLVATIKTIRDVDYICVYNEDECEKLDSSAYEKINDTEFKLYFTGNSITNKKIVLVDYLEKELEITLNFIKFTYSITNDGVIENPKADHPAKVVISGNKPFVLETEAGFADWVANTDNTKYTKEYYEVKTENVTIKVDGKEITKTIEITGTFNNEAPEVIGKTITLLPDGGYTLTIQTNKDIKNITDGWVKTKEESSEDYYRTFSMIISGAGSYFVELEDFLKITTDSPIEVAVQEEDLPYAFAITGMKFVYNDGTEYTDIADLEKTNKNITWVITVNKELNEEDLPNGWSFLENDSSKKVITRKLGSNKTYNVTLKTADETVSTSIVLDDIICKTFETSINNYATYPTNKDVTVTITTDKPVTFSSSKTSLPDFISEWKKFNNELNHEQYYEENVGYIYSITYSNAFKETVTITDDYGNKTKYTIAVDINKTEFISNTTEDKWLEQFPGTDIVICKPVLEPNTPTKKSVTCTVKFSKPVSQVTFNSFDNLVAFVDNAGDVSLDEESGVSANLSLNRKTLKVTYDNTTSSAAQTLDFIASSVYEGDENLSISLNIPEIDVDAPIITDANIQKEYKQNIDRTWYWAITITANEALQPLAGWSFVNDNHKVIYAEVTEQLKSIVITDLAGNSQKVTLSLPEPDQNDFYIKSIDINPSTLTMDSVLVTLELSHKITEDITEECEEDNTIGCGWTKVKSTKYTKVFDDNTDINFTISDIYGRQANVRKEINNIDKTPLVVTVDESYKDVRTNEPVKIKFISNKKLNLEDIENEIILESNPSADEWIYITYLYHNEVFVFKDFAGYTNASTPITISLDGIYFKEYLEVTYEFSNKEKQTCSGTSGDNKCLPTNTNVALIIDSGIKELRSDVQSTYKLLPIDEPVRDEDGNITEGTYRYLKIYHYNVTDYNLILKDIYGNTTENLLKINIDWIDKDAPAIENIITTPADLTSWTNENFTISATISDIQSGLIAYTFTNEANPENVATDKWILATGKTPLTVVSDEFSENATYYIHVKDIAGNVATETVVISKIDQTDPTITNVSTGDADLSKWTNSSINLSATIADSQSGLYAYAIKGNNEQVQWYYFNEITDCEDILEGICYSYPISRIITNNDTYNIWVMDNAGNTKEILATNITKIDSDNPQINNIATSTTNSTNQNVTISAIISDITSGVSSYSIFKDDELVLEKDINISDLECSQVTDSVCKSYNLSYDAQTNGTYIINIKDAAGNDINSNPIIINNIDKVPLEIQVEYSAKKPVVDSVTVTISSTNGKQLTAKTGWQLVNNTLVKEFDSNTSTEGVEVWVSDKAGNQAKALINIQNIYKDGILEVGVEYSPETLTTGPVTVKIIPTMPINDINYSGCTQTLDENNKEYYVCTFNENITTTITVVDTNDIFTEFVTIDIDWIDNVNPEVTNITKTPASELTNGNVTIKATLKDGLGKGEFPSYLSGVKSYAVTKDDELLSTATWNNITSTECTTKLPEDDNICIEANISFTKNTNGEYHIWVKDGLGNISEVANSINVDNIDNLAPAVSSVTDNNAAGWRNTAVLINATLTDSQSGVSKYYISTSQVAPTATDNVWLEAFNCDNEKKSCSIINYSITQNGTYYIHTMDLLKNIGTGLNPIIITNVDMDMPTIKDITPSTSILTNQSITISANIQDVLSGLDYYIITDQATAPTNGWTKVNGTLPIAIVSEAISKNGTYYIYVKDNAGNIYQDSIYIGNIDTVKPTLNVSYSNKWTNNTVTATVISTNKNIVSCSSPWIKITDNTCEYTYEENKTENITVTDAAGNTASMSVTINNIDKTAPTVGTATASTTAPVKKDGSVTLTATLTDNASGIYAYAVSTSSTSAGINASEWKTIGCTLGATCSKTYTVNASVTDNATYYIWAKDSAGIISNVSSTIEVKNIYKTIPTITVSTSDIILNLNDNWNPSNYAATAKDHFGVNLTVTTTNNVISGVAGEYSINYSATDVASQTKAITRKVIVQDVAINSLSNKNCNSSIASDGCYLTDNTKNRNDNYIWYSGHLWRAYKVNNDGTVKLVTEDSVSAFSYGPFAYMAYPGNVVSDWLNDNFLKSLNSNAQNTINSTKYCISSHPFNSNHETQSMTFAEAYTSCSNDPNTPSDKSYKVALLTIDEYVIVGGANSYLNTGDLFYTMTPAVSQYNSYKLWTVLPSGATFYNADSEDSNYGVRPVITLNKNATIYEGNGTKTNPYRITGDTSADTSKTIKPNLNSRDNIGEYVTFGKDSYNSIWRIQNINGTTKLILNDLYKPNGTYYTSSYGNNNFNNNSSDSNGIGYKLNHEIKNNLFNSTQLNYLDSNSTYYITGYQKATNPKDNSLKTTGAISGNGLIGLPRFGDLLSARPNTLNNKPTTDLASWTLTYNSTEANEVWIINTAGAGSSYGKTYTQSVGVMPVITLKSDVKIQSGKGTPNNPYVLTR